MKPFKYKDIRLIAVESTALCLGCYFHDRGMCGSRMNNSILCTSNLRPDRLNVIFVEYKFKFGK
jgi:hypothetical protein